MRIYIAGFFASSGVRSINAHVTRSSKPEWLLESYYYFTTKGVAELKESGASIFLDSGAYTMFTQGVEVDLGRYADFNKENQDIIHIASSLDVIGRGQEQASYDNFKKLRGFGANVQPVHHARDDDKWLQKYIDEGHEYIFLGGMVAESSNYLRDWLDHVWERYLTNKDGTPKVKVHGFGLTTLALMLRYPWFSVDSTRWVLLSRYGGILMDFPQQTKMIDFSTQSMKRFNDNGWHYSTLKPIEKQAVDEHLAWCEARRLKDSTLEKWLEEETGIKQGFNAVALAEMFGWRDRFNIEFFTRIQHNNAKTFHREQMGLFS